MQNKKLLLVVVVLVALLTTSAIAQDDTNSELEEFLAEYMTDITFDVSTDGSAQVTLIEKFITLGYEIMDLTVNADQAGFVKLSGFVQDDGFDNGEDLKVDFKLNGQDSETHIIVSGSDSELIKTLGESDLAIDLVDNDGTLEISITGNLDKRFLGESENANELVGNGDMLVASLKESIYTVSSLLSLQNTPEVTSTRSEISDAGSSLRLDIKIMITHWRELYTKLTEADYTYQDPEETTLQNCLGLTRTTSEKLAEGMNIGTSRITIKGGKDLRITMVTRDGYGLSVPGMPSLETADLKIVESKDRLSVSGSVKVKEFTKLVECLTATSLGKALKLGDLQISIEKKENEDGEIRIESKVNNLVTTRGKRKMLEIPSEITSGSNVTIKLPEGMEVGSVIGAKRVSSAEWEAIPGENVRMIMKTGNFSIAGNWMLIFGGVVILLLVIGFVRHR